MIRLGLLLLLMWVAMLGALKVAASANAVTLTGQSTNTTPAFLKYAWSTPVSGGTLTGITGTLSITSQGYFGEMLASVVVWPQGNCPPQGSEWATYESMSAAYPGSALLAHYILKYGGVGTSTVNVGVSGLSASVAGCVGVLLDGSNFSGSAFTMSANLQLQVGANAKVQTLTSLDDEFCFVSYGCQAYTLSGGTFAKVVRFNTAAKIVGLYGNLSDAQLPWNVVAGAWTPTNDVYVDKGCRQFGSEGMYGPGTWSRPAGAVSLIHSTQSSQTFDLHPNVVLSAGDCIVHLVSVQGGGAVDAEMQLMIASVPVVSCRIPYLC